MKFQVMAVGRPRMCSALTAANAICLDFSVAKDGYLAAYSFDGEAVLDSSKLTCVSAGQ